jgi:signal transduction histidine kinase
MWDTFFYAAVVIVAAATLATPGSRASTVGSLVCVGLLVVAYTVLGRRAARTGDRRLAIAYLALLVALTVAQVGFDNLGGVLLFVAYSQVWFFAERRREGVWWVTALSVGVAARFVHLELRAGESPWSVVGQMAVALVFAIVLGLWVTQIAELSEERAALVERLEAAQAEVAATHHAAGVAAERQRMAQEIHDTLAQGFTSVVMLAQTTTAELDRGHEDAARGRVEQIEHVARQNLAEARALVAAFGPADLQEATLGEALGRLAERFAAQTGVPVDLAPGTSAAATGLERDVQVALLRAAQEALANVRKHADASRVRLALARDGDEVRLAVSDDGRGLPRDLVEGHGLRGMRERARVGGGDLALEGAPGAGTHVTLTLPVGGRAADDEGTGA